MAENYSVEAVLSVYDKGFSAGMEKAAALAGNLDKTAGASVGSIGKLGAGFGIAATVASAATSAISSGVGDVFQSLNESSAAWQTYEGNMQQLGASSKTISSVKKELSDFATKSIYSASDMASTYSQLSAVGIKSADKLVTGFGGLAAAAENPKQAMKTLSMQATQMASKPMVQWQDFRLMLEQTPAGIAGVAKAMGMTTDELVKNVQDGKVKTEDFFNAIQKVGNTGKFAQMATEYKTVGQAMDGLVETITTKLQPAFDAISQVLIKAVGGFADLLTSSSPLAGVIGAIAIAVGTFVAVITTVSVALQVAAAAQAVFNAVMAMNPFVLIIAAVVAVVAALTFFFTQTKLGKAIWQDFGGFLTGLWQGIVSLASGIWNGLVSIITGAWNLIKAGASAVWNGIVAVITTVWNAIVTVITTYISLVTAFWTGAWNILKTVVSVVWNGIVTVITTVWTTIVTAITTYFSMLSALWSASWNLLTTVVSTVWNTIVTVITTVWNTITSVVSSAISTVSSVVTSVFSAISSFLSGIMNSIASVFTSGWNKAKSITTSAMNAAKNAVNNAAKATVSAGQNFVMGFVRGITGFIGQAASAAARMAKAALSAAKGALGIHSPSRVMRDEVGYYVGAGMAKGILGNVSAVEKASEELANKAVIDPRRVDMSSQLNQLSNLGQQAFSGNYNGSMQLQDSSLQMQNNALLRRIAEKGTDLYLDGRTLVGGTLDTTNEMLGNQMNLKGRWN